MHKYAQIKDGEVCWLFEHEAQNLDELYDKYFCKDHIEIVSLDDTTDVAEGMAAEFTDAGYVFKPMTAPLTQTLMQLENGRQEAAKVLIWAERDACMLGNTYRQAELKKVYKAMAAAYEDILALSDESDNADGVIAMLTNFIEQLRSINNDIN